MWIKGNADPDSCREADLFGGGMNGDSVVESGGGFVDVVILVGSGGKWIRRGIGIHLSLRRGNDDALLFKSRR